MKRADYGQDAPGVLRNQALASAALLVAAGVSWVVTQRLPDLTINFLVMGVIAGAFAAYTWWSSHVGKFHVRDRLLDHLDWSGEESVLDIGCGRGLALIGAAKRAVRGRLVGVDLWSNVDLSSNSAAALTANVEAEGVAARVTWETGDARSLPFPDASFDRVVSMTAIHNIKEADGRAKAISEMMRVLKPGGRFAVFDIFKTSEYRAALKKLGVAELEVSGPVLLWAVSGACLWGRKPS